VNRSRLQRPASARAFVRPKALRIEQPPSLTGRRRRRSWCSSSLVATGPETAPESRRLTTPGGGYDRERQRQSHSPSQRPNTPPRGALLAASRRSRRYGQHATLVQAARAYPPAQAEGHREGARTGAAREASRSGRCAVKRVSLLRGHVEDIERFESGARGVGRLLHTSGRRILSAGIGERREAFGGQAGQLRGELPPEDAGEKGPGRYKGARAARGNCKGNARNPRPLEETDGKPTRDALGPEPSLALNRRAEGTAPGEEELEARRKTGEGGRRGRWSSVTRRSSSRQRAPEARYTRFAPPADEARGVRGRRERSWHGRPCPRAAPGRPSRSRRG